VSAVHRALRWVLTAAIVAGVGIAGYAYWTSRDNGTTFSAYFSRSTGLYDGDDVKVLGVKVGEVDSIQPGPDHVKITFTIDDNVPIPAGAKAAIVAPNLVTQRFIQLAPAYTGGPTLHSGAAIPLARTAVPIEWNDVETQLTRLATALGPNGANKTGALSGVVNTADANLTGSAAQLHDMLHTLSEASDTIASNRGNLFGTISSLETFVNALDRSDSSVRSFSAQLADFSGLLDENRSNLALALSELDSAVSDVTSFVAHNRSAVKTSVGSLATLAKILSAKQYQLADLLHVSPTALSNFYNIIDPRYNAATGTLAAANFDDVAQLVCRQIVETGGTVADCLAVLQPLVNQLGLLKLPAKIQRDVERAAAQQKAKSSAPGLPSLPPVSLPKLTQPISNEGKKILGILLPGSSG
jgi:phospholipid/cholesterol/gamma-HCH transport system substrate-binding protein